MKHYIAKFKEGKIIYYDKRRNYYKDIQGVDYSINTFYENSNNVVEYFGKCKKITGGDKRLLVRFFEDNYLPLKGIINLYGESKEFIIHLREA